MAGEIAAAVIFDRIKRLYALETDAALARHLGMYPQDIARQKKTDNVPYEAILKACHPADWPVIFLGREVAPRDTDAALAFLLSKGYRIHIEPGPPLAQPAQSPQGSPEPKAEG